MTQNNRPAQRRPVARPATGARPAPTRQGQPRPVPPRQAARPAPRRAAPPRTAPAPLGGFFSGGLIPVVLLSVVAIALGIALQYAMPDGFVLRKNRNAEVPATQAVSEIYSDGPLRLNEIMTANSGILVDAAGKTPDWVEVANVSSRAANLEGYVLARNAKAGNVFVFPSMTLQPGECVLVYADGDLRAEAGKEFHAPFRLSSGGDVLMLFNAAEVAVDTVNIPALGANASYARRTRDSWEVETRVTPGQANTADNYAMMNTVRSGSDVTLSEIVASNTRFRPDASGVYHDYVLLRNSAGVDVDMSGWYLSDDPSIPRKWRFPDGASIPAGGTLTVYCSGQEYGTGADLHASFRLSTEGETVTLSDATGQPVDQVTYDLLRPDTAWIKNGNGGWAAGEPTK